MMYDYKKLEQRKVNKKMGCARGCDRGHTNAKMRLRHIPHLPKSRCSRDLSFSLHFASVQFKFLNSLVGTSLVLNTGDDDDDDDDDDCRVDDDTVDDDDATFNDGAGGSISGYSWTIVSQIRRSFSDFRK